MDNEEGHTSAAATSTQASDAVDDAVATQMDTDQSKNETELDDTLEQPPVITEEDLVRSAKCRAGSLEYEAQFFGFSPRALTDTMHDVLLEGLEECVENVLKSKEGITEADAAALAVQTSYNNPVIPIALTKVIDLLENFLVVKLFVIPCSLLLPSDAVHANAPVDDQHRHEMNMKFQEKLVKLKMNMAAIEEMNLKKIEMEATLKLLEDAKRSEQLID